MLATRGSAQHPDTMTQLLIGEVAIAGWKKDHLAALPRQEARKIRACIGRAAADRRKLGIDDQDLHPRHGSGFLQWLSQPSPAAVTDLDVADVMAAPRQ